MAEQRNETTLRVLIAEQIQGLRRAKNRSLLGANEDFERERNAVGAREKQSNNATKTTLRVLIAEQIQGLRRAKNRSLLDANEDFERERNEEIAHRAWPNNETKQL